VDVPACRNAYSSVHCYNSEPHLEICYSPSPFNEPCVLQEPAAVSQGVLLSLLQQLGTDLAFLPATVLPWIREAALALDPQVSFATHVLAAALSTSPGLAPAA